MCIEREHRENFVGIKLLREGIYVEEARERISMGTN